MLNNGSGKIMRIQKKVYVLLVMFFVSTVLFAQVKAGAVLENTYPVSSYSNLFKSRLGNGIKVEVPLKIKNIEGLGVCAKYMNGIDLASRPDVCNSYYFSILAGCYYNIPIFKAFSFQIEAEYGINDYCGDLIDTQGNLSFFNSLNQIIGVSPALRYDIGKWSFCLGGNYYVIPQKDSWLNEFGFSLAAITLCK